MPFVVAFWILLGSVTGSQQATLLIEVTVDNRPLAGAEVNVAGLAYVTNRSGQIVVPVGPGTMRLVVSHEGYLTVSRDVHVRPGSEERVIVALDPDTAFSEHITVSATRTDKRLEDQPMRVEVLVREEIEEKMLMTPGDIVMMLNEMGGMRVQATSPSLGAASVRVQGMRGRYTRFLSDGLPLFGEQPGGLGLLQIPPMDLGQVEVIKGVASALYGAGAMGGVVDLISRRPAEAPEREVLLNQSSRGGTDAVLWLSAPAGSDWGVTFLGGGHFQQLQDVNGDGWSDLPDFNRGVVRPRFFWDNGVGESLFATIGVTAESRRGGTSDDGGPADSRLAHVEALDTLRVDGGMVARALTGNGLLLTARAAASRHEHDHRFGDVLERDRHVNLFGELTVNGSKSRHTWVAGLAVERSTFTPRDVPRFQFAHTVPGLFAQDDVALTKWFSVSASGRLDWHSEYGWFFSPRVSSLARASGWSSRISLGTGFFAPTALTEETEAAGLTRLVMPRALEAERGRSFSLDVTREVGPLSATATFFRSSIRSPVHVERTSRYAIYNLAEPTTNTGGEALATLRVAPFSVTGSYTYVRARERHEGRTSDVPLTPRHSAGAVAMAEWEDSGRIGVEWYYTGVQHLDGDPFRTTTEPYVVFGMLAERRIGRFRLFVNGENLTGTRQTRWSRVIRPSPAADGRLTTDIWAPLEGRSVNAGVRIHF